MLRYCVDLAGATRAHRAVEVGASPRGSQALLLVARALAVLDGREYVLPEDVKECAVAALAHRLTLRAETWSSGITGAQVVTELLDQVPGPATTRPDRHDRRAGRSATRLAWFKARSAVRSQGWRRTDALVRAVVVRARAAARRARACTGSSWC